MSAKIGTAYVDVQGDFSSLISGTNAALAPLTAKFGKLGLAGAGAVAGIAAGAGLAGKALYDLGAQFDDASDRIRIGTGKSGKALAKLNKDFEAVYRTVPSGMSDTADAIAQLNERLGVSGKPLRQMARQILNLSRLTETDLGTNIQQITRLFGDWGIATKRQGPTLDALFRLTQKTGIQLSDLAESMVKFGSPLRQLGFNFNTAAAMFAKFEKEGVNTQTLLPGLRFAIKAFSGATASTTKDLKAWGVSLTDPQKALGQVMDLIKAAPTDLKANAIAFEVFGQRAGPDMAAAIREGRFSLRDLIDEMKNGQGTIDGTAKKTNDLGENWAIFTHNMQVLLRPAADFVFKTLGKLSQALVDLNLGHAIREIQKFVRTNGDLKSFIRAVQNVAKVLNYVFGPIIRSVISAAKRVLEGFLTSVRGIVRIISGILTGDFGKAWQGVKDLFSGSIKILKGWMQAMAAPFKRAASIAGDALSGAFSAAWKTIRNVFSAGVDAIRGFVQAILDVINVIPGVDIQLGGGGGSSGGPRGTHAGSHDHKRAGQYARGGQITRPSYIVGEEAPRHNEWVIATNPAYRRRNLSYWAQAGHDLGIPGFALGGLASDAAGAVTDTVGSLIGKLPSPHLPPWMGDLGGWILSQATDFIKGNSKKLGAFTGLGSMKGAPAVFKHLAQIWQPNHPRWDVWQTGLALASLGFLVAENPHFGGVSPVHTEGSYHYSGRAIDVNTAAGGSSELSAFYKVAPWLLKFHPKDPLIEDAGGSNQHLHFAYRRGGLLGRIPGFRSGGVVRPGRGPDKVGMILKGYSSYFGGGATAGGSDTSRPGIALNLHPPTTAGWNNAITRHWRDSSLAGHPIYAQVSVQGKRAIMPITDMGPSTDKTVDVTEGGVRKLGLSGRFANAFAQVLILGKRGGHGRFYEYERLFGKGKGAGGGGGAGSKGHKPPKPHAIVEAGGVGVTGAPGKGGGRTHGSVLVVDIPGLPRVIPIPRSIRSLPEWIQRLAYPTMPYTGLEGLASTAIDVAGNTVNVKDDRYARQFQMDIERARLRQVARALRKVKGLLKARGLDPKQRTRLRNTRLKLVGLYASLRADLARGLGLEAGTAGSDARLENLKALLSESQARTAVSQAQYGVLANLPEYGGSFAQGGVVPGPAGQPTLITAHGGEQYLGVGEKATEREMIMRLVIDDRRTRAFIGDREIRAIVREETTRGVRAGSRPLPGRGGG